MNSDCSQPFIVFFSARGLERLIIIIIIYNLYRGKAPVTGSDFQGGPLKIKYTKAKNIQYN